MKSVYSAVRTGDLNKAVCASALEGLKQNGKKQGGNEGTAVNGETKRTK
jgi:hypothetical protein